MVPLLLYLAIAYLVLQMTCSATLMEISAVEKRIKSNPRVGVEAELPDSLALELDDDDDHDMFQQVYSSNS
jgi:hypothetical protein